MKKLKRVVLRIPLFPKYYEFYDLFEKNELIQIHRQDDDHISVTQKVKFKDNKMHPKMLEGEHFRMSYIEVIEENREKGEYIFFSTHNLIKETKDLLDKIKGLIIDPPLILDKNRLLVNVIIDNKNTDDFFESMASLFNEEIEILSISHMHPNYENLFLKLTDRQKEIIYYTVQNGYYEIPRGINSKIIANHFKISRSALYEHLRKIERTIYHSIFK